DGGGDGKSADRGLPAPFELNNIKDIAKLIKEGVDAAKPLAKDLKEGKLTPESIDALAAIVQKIKPDANITELKAQLARAGDLFTAAKDGTALAQEIMKGNLSPESVDKALAIAQKVVPGLDVAKAKEEFQKLEVQVDHAIEIKKKVDEFAAKGYPEVR